MYYVIFFFNLVSVSFFSYTILKQRKDILGLRQDIEGTKSKTKAICYSINNIGQKLFSTEEMLSEYANRSIEVAKYRKVNPAYEQASKIFAYGGSIDDVLESCNISKPEAVLLQSLVNKKKLQNNNQ